VDIIANPYLLPSSSAPIKPANPVSPGKIAVKTERERQREASDHLIPTQWIGCCWWDDRRWRASSLKTLTLAVP